jgi:uncharacterized membrane protein YbhN (UPF0104 family)
MRLLRPFLALLIVGVSIYFFSQALLGNWEKVRELSLAPGPLVGAGIVLLVLSVVSTGWLWGGLLNFLIRDTAVRVSAAEAVRVHLISWLMKYIPGQAGSFLTKMSWARRKGIAKSTVASSFLYENILLIFASVLPTVPIVAWVVGEKLFQNLSVMAPLILVVAPLLFVLNTKLFYGSINRGLNKIGRAPIPENLFIAPRSFFNFQAQFLLPRVLNGAGFVCIAASLLEVTPGMYVPLAAMYVFAGIIGFLAILVPSGLGVREAVLVLLLSAYFPTEQAAAVAIAARFYATIADLGVLGLYGLLSGREKRKGVTT